MNYKDFFEFIGGLTMIILASIGVTWIVMSALGKIVLK